nr:PREDICTED: uncharacterized protein LOC105661967 [Megachile rotundata]
MECLGQIEAVKEKIKTASVAAIRSLHKFIFHDEGDRSNRKRVRNFEGFAFAIDSEEYTAQLEYARRLTTGDLISSCNVLGIDFTGSKEEIIVRMCSALMDLNQLVKPNDEEEEKEGEEDDDKNAADEMGNDSGSERDIEVTPARQQERDVNFAFGFKDMENTLRTFDGSNAYPVEKWIEDFEEAAEIFQWTELQRLIFAKRSLSGLAKLFIQSERAINSWCKLKNALKKEFVSKANSAQIHKMLSKRKLLA